MTGLLGPSGCGKTTLMRTLVGVQQITGGTVEVFGAPAGSASLRDQIGYVTQQASVYDDLTVAENLRFFGRILGVDDARVDECIETVSLGDHRDRVVARLSGGQRSRVSLAVALLGEPDGCWSSTSRRSGSTRCCASSCGRPSTGWRSPARRCWSRAT